MRNPYEPPEALVVDESVRKPRHWGRTIHVNLAAFFFVLALVCIFPEGIMPAVELSSVAMGLALTGVLSFQPVRSLLRQSKSRLPVYFELGISALTIGLVAGAYAGHAWLALTLGLPLLLVNLVVGLAALFVERRHRVHVFNCARSYDFVPVDG